MAYEWPSEDPANWDDSTLPNFVTWFKLYHADVRAWLREARIDIIRLEGKAGFSKGDPGDPPGPPW